MIVSSSAIRISNETVSPLGEPVEDLDRHPAGPDGGIGLRQPPRLLELHRVEAEPAPRLVRLLAERPCDGHRAALLHRVQMGEMCVLQAVELLLRELVRARAAPQQHEAEALELHQLGNTTSARSPPLSASRSEPCSSSRTSARTIESPVPSRPAVQPAPVVGDGEQDVAVPPRELDADGCPAVLEGVLEELAEDEGERGGAVASERDRLQLGLDLLRRPEALHEHRAQPVDQLRELHVVLAVLGEHLVDGGDREDAVHGVVQRLTRIDRVGAPRLQPEERRDRLQVVLDSVVDLLGEHAAHDRAPVLERDRGVVRDRREERALLLGERRVAVADQLSDLAALPPERQPDGVLPRAALGPRDIAVLEHERGSGRADRVHRRLDDRLQRLLEVERFRDRLRDPRERLELADAATRLAIELRVLDRLRHLRGDREQEVDLGRRERPRRPGANVERAGELLPGQDGDGEDRLVLVLGQVLERPEARVEMRLLGDHHRLAAGGGRAGDPLAGPHPRACASSPQPACRAWPEGRARRRARRTGRRSRRRPRARPRPCSRPAKAPRRGRASNSPPRSSRSGAGGAVQWRPCHRLSSRATCPRTTGSCSCTSRALSCSRVERRGRRGAEPCRAIPRAAERNRTPARPDPFRGRRDRGRRLS